MNEVQIISKDGEPEWAILPYAEYQRLRALDENAHDLSAALRVLDDESEEWLPFELTERVLDGEILVRVWREHRGLAQKALADKAGLSQAYVSDIETGKQDGSVKALRALAEALGVGLDDLLSEPPHG
ncbi:MAG: helix-turn-helix transcriptional regulator [Proteobacteria bacterium]|nr:helix-turn-helix transcriptional regulator [Pseudomonadota bacterium]